MSRFIKAAKIAALFFFLAMVALSMAVLLVVLEGVFVLWFAIISWGLLLLTLVVVRSHWKFVAGAVAYDRAATLLERLIDWLMIAMLVADHSAYGIALELLVCTPLYLIHCIVFVMIYDFFLERGRDLAGVDKVKRFKDAQLAKEEYGFVGWYWNRTKQEVLRRRFFLFLVGSIFFFDPNIVTVFFRKGSKSGLGDFVLITVPSVVLAMSFYTGIYLLGIRGVWSYEDFLVETLREVLIMITRV